MTVPATARRTRVEIARERAEPVLGRRVAKRVAAFGNGDLYVEAGPVRRFLAWFLDIVVFATGVVVVLGLISTRSDLSDDTVAILALGSLLVVPLLYGLCYGNGRALGALLTGTRLVRVKDGGRIGAKACWAMLLRTVLVPLVLIAVIVAFFAGDFLPVDGSLVRTSIDRDATRRLRELDLPEG